MNVNLAILQINMEYALTNVDKIKFTIKKHQNVNASLVLAKLIMSVKFAHKNLSQLKVESALSVNKIKI